MGPSGKVMTEADVPPLVRCPACEATEWRHLFEATERMHGLGGRFRVEACARCGLQRLADPPADLARYYPGDYYAYDKGEAVPRTPTEERRHRLWLDLYRARYDPAFPAGPRRALLRRLKDAQVRGLVVRPGARFLDVGCGDGRFLEFARDLGLDVAGVEPGAGAKRAQARGLDVREGTLLDARFPDAAFDVVAFNHSFEHVPDPEATLREASRILRPGGLVVVAVPNADSWAARRFGEHWAQLDAPRHLYGWSPRTLGLLGARVGLEVARVRWLSRPWSVAASLRYRRNDRRARPKLLNDRSGLAWHPLAHAALEPFVAALDAMKKGDTVEVWLKKASGR